MTNKERSFLFYEMTTELTHVLTLSFTKNLFELNMSILTKPHPVRKEINKWPIPEEAEKAVSMLAERISNILHP